MNIFRYLFAIFYIIVLLFLSGGRLKDYFFSKLNLMGIYILSICMLKIVYFIGNLDKYLLQMVDTNTGLLCKAFKGFPCSNIFELGLIHN